MFDYGGGLIALLVLIANVYAIVKVLQSNAGTGAKVLWIVGVIVFPIIGFLIWLLLGPRQPAAGLQALDPNRTANWRRDRPRTSTAATARSRRPTV